MVANMLTQPSPLPPRGIFIPTTMLFHSELPSAVLLTWIQLRALAWKGWSTPPLSLSELASLIGIHPNRLEKHLANLQGLAALSLRSDGNGKLVVSFPEPPALKPAQPAMRSGLPTPSPSSILTKEASSPASYFPRQILGYITYSDKPDIPAQQDDASQISAEAAKPSASLDPVLSIAYQEVT
jgi:hypothetical protein